MTKDLHEVYSFRVADDTGSIELVLWDELGRLINPGDILEITEAHVTLFKNMLKLYLGKTGSLRRKRQ